MRKVVFFLTSLVMVYVNCGMAFALVPETPNLTVTTDGITVSLSWTASTGADGYTLYYAPYLDASYIGEIPTGNQISYSIDLWDGAAFYVAVKAYNSAGSSDYSNIEIFYLNDTVVEGNSAELWVVKSIDSSGYSNGEWTINRAADGSLSVSGLWESTDVNWPGAIIRCPFAHGPASVSGTSVSFTATGTATHSTAPPLYNTASFILTVNGNTSSGYGSGTSTIEFLGFGWPSSVLGTWTGTRISGSGITQE